MSQKIFSWIDCSLSNRSLQFLPGALASSFTYSIYGFNRAELYFCFKTILFELSNHAKPFLFSALIVYGPSHLCENFPPFLSCLRLFSNNTLSPTLTFVADRCRRSKSRFCFSCVFFISPSNFVTASRGRRTNLQVQNSVHILNRWIILVFGYKSNKTVNLLMYDDALGAKQDIDYVRPLIRILIQNLSQCILILRFWCSTKPLFCGWYADVTLCWVPVI